MTSKILIEALVAAVQASPIHKDVRVYISQTNSGGFWRAVFIGEPDRISRIERFNKSLESLWGGAETSNLVTTVGKEDSSDKVVAVLEVS